MFTKLIWRAPLVAALLLCLVCGCESLHGHSDSAGPQGADVSKEIPAVASPAHSLDGNGGMLGNRLGPNNEQISLMSQRMASLDDDRKVLTARLEQVSAQLEEKEKALTLANREIQEATTQIVKTRNELQTWKKEMVAVRDKLGTMEKENRDTLETMIHTLEKMLERDAGKAGEPMDPESLPQPRKQ